MTKTNRNVRIGLVLAGLIGVGLGFQNCGSKGFDSATGLSSTTPRTVCHTSEAHLTWERPTTNEDGSPANNLAGYTIYYGTQSHNYTSTVNLMDAMAQAATVTDLAPGTYYFAIKALTSDGGSSDYSNEAAVTYTECGASAKVSFGGNTQGS